MYKKAKANEIKNFTGIDSPYETPEKPDLVVDTNKDTLYESVYKILSLLINKDIINKN